MVFLRQSCPCQPHFLVYPSKSTIWKSMALHCLQMLYQQSHKWGVRQIVTGEGGVHLSPHSSHHTPKGQATSSWWQQSAVGTVAMWEPVATALAVVQMVVVDAVTVLVAEVATVVVAMRRWPPLAVVVVAAVVVADNCVRSLCPGDVAAEGCKICMYTFCICSHSLSIC